MTRSGPVRANPGRERWAGARLAHGGIADGQHVAGAQRTAAHPRHDVDGRAAHGFGHADAAAHRQVAARPGTSGAAAHGLPGLNLDGGPQRQAGAEIGAGERDDGVGFELESAAYQRHFERRGVFRIAHQEVARAQGQGIGGAGRGDAEVRVAEAAEVLDRGLEAR